ncbi:MAG TPA: YcxB family protein [Bacillota bacterium]|nr:YcxB family protein [Bacillota bacterium]
MVIKTKEFTFPRTLYISILIQEQLRRSWWAGVFLVGIAVYQSTQKNSLGALWLAFPAAYFGYILLRCWMHANAKKNQLFFGKRHFEVDEKFIYCRFSEGTVNKIVINDIARVVKNRQFYRLFLNKKQFVYLPVNAFKTTGDMQRFDEMLKSRKRPSPIKRGEQ